MIINETKPINRCMCNRVSIIDAKLKKLDTHMVVNRYDS